MTDNQKRAHDLAILVLKKLDIACFMEPSAADGEEFKVDLYEKYKEAYTAALDALNRDFPDGK